MKKKVLDIDLISFVSHELKTPLSTLRLNADMLLRQTSGENKKQIEMMSEEINWMIQFISDTLDLKRVENNLVLNFAWHNWKNWLNAIQSEIERKINFSDRKLKVYDLTDKNGFIYIDSVYMKQALINLVINAIEHSPENSLIEVSFVPKTKQSHPPSSTFLEKNKSHFTMHSKIKNMYGRVQKLFCNIHNCLSSKNSKTKNKYSLEKDLQIQVKDQGPGFKEENMNKIFEPFYSTKKGMIKNNGLGLPISKKIIEAHSGIIYAQNRLDKQGTVLTFTLPYYLSKDKTKGQKANRP